MLPDIFIFPAPPIPPYPYNSIGFETLDAVIKFELTRFPVLVYGNLPR